MAKGGAQGRGGRGGAAKSAGGKAAGGRSGKGGRFGRQMPEGDEIDEFMANKDVVALDGGRGKQHDDTDESDQEETVFDLNNYSSDDGSASEDDGDEDMEDVPPAKAKGKLPAKPAAKARKADSEEDDDEDDDVDDIDMDDDDDDDEDGEDEDDDTKRDGPAGTTGWGHSRKAFYDADDANEADAKDEEVEALRLQKQKLKQMDEADFALEEPLESRVATKGKGKAGKELRASAAAAMQKSAQVQAAVEKVQRDLSALSKEDKLQLVISDSPELLSLLEDFKRSIVEINEQVAPVIQQVQAQQLPTKRGLTFLHVKLQLMLSYVTHLSFYLLLKAQGASVRDHPVMDNLLKIRTMLDRIRPLDAKLQNQIERLLKVGTADAASGAKPNLDALVPHGEEGEASDEEQATTQSSKKYVPLKLGTDAYPADVADSKDRKALEKKRRALQKSAMLQELKEAVSDAPEEMQESTAESKKLNRLLAEQESYEEEKMSRLILTKEQKKLRKKLAAQSQRWDSLADIGDFGDVEALVEGEEDNTAGQVRAVADAVNRVQQRHRQAVAKAAEISGEQDTAPISKPKKRAIDFEDNTASHFGGRDMDDEPAAGGYESDDSAYKAAVENSRAKKANKRARSEKAAQEASDRAAASVLPEDAYFDGGKRKASKTILKNRGLVKYRNAKDSTPRLRLRNKFDKKLKARKGQVQDVRAGEAGMYAGELSGVRSNLSRSHQLKT